MSGIIRLCRAGAYVPAAEDPVMKLAEHGYAIEKLGWFSGPVGSPGEHVYSLRYDGIFGRETMADIAGIVGDCFSPGSAPDCDGYGRVVSDSEARALAASPLYQGEDMVFPTLSCGDGTLDTGSEDIEMNAPLLGPVHEGE